MHYIREVSPLFMHLYRHFGSVTTPQLMRLVTDLDKRVYRFQHPVALPPTPKVQIDPVRNPILNKVFTQQSRPAIFGDLADQGGIAV